MWKKEILENTVLYKLNCACGCKESSNVVVFEEDEDEFYYLRFEIEPAIRTRSAWNEWRILEFFEMLSIRISLASKILFKGEAKYISDTIIDESNIDELFEIVKDARKRIKSKKN